MLICSILAEKRFRVHAFKSVKNALTFGRRKSSCDEEQVQQGLFVLHIQICKYAFFYVLIFVSNMKDKSTTGTSGGKQQCS